MESKRLFSLPNKYNERYVSIIRSYKLINYFDKNLAIVYLNAYLFPEILLFT